MCALISALWSTFIVISLFTDVFIFSLDEYISTKLYVGARGTCDTGCNWETCRKCCFYFPHFVLKTVPSYTQCFFCKRIFSGTHILIFDWRPQYSTLELVYSLYVN